MKPERCQAITKNGSPCGATPVPGDTLCAWHAPSWEEKRRAWSRKGGEARSNKSRAKKQLPDNVMTPSELQGLLGLVLKGVVAGKIAPSVGNAVANLGRTIIATQEAAEFDARLATLEAGDVAAEPPA